MVYRIDPRKSPAAELRRIALDELDAALTSLADPDAAGLDRSVHAVRKSCKRLRSLARLVRPALGRRYAQVNDDLRQAAATLSPLRDAHAVLATFDEVLAARSDRVPAHGLDDVRAALAARADIEQDPRSVDARLGQAATFLQRLCDDVDHWQLSDDLRAAIDSVAVYHGLARTAFRQSLDDPTAERLHEWRKRVKDCWHHTQLLAALAPSALQPAERSLERLSDALGDNNDLAVLGRLLRESPDQFGSAQARDAAQIIQGVQDQLVRRCWPLGANVYAEDRKAYRRRLRRYEQTYRTFGRERRLGEIAVIFPAAGGGDCDH